MLPFEENLPFENKLPFEEDTPSVAKGPNDFSKQYNEYLKGVKQRRMRPSIPGAEDYDNRPAMSYDEYVADVEKRNKDRVKGYGEAALSFATGIPATLAAALSGISAPINPLAQNKDPLKQFEQVLGDLTYAPRTLEGQQTAQDIGHFMQAFPVIGSYVHIPNIKAPKKPKTDPVVENLRNKAGEVKAPEALPFEEDLGTAVARDRYNNDRTVERLEQALAKPNQELPPIQVDQAGTAMLPNDAATLRQTQAQQALEARQRALEEQVARQGTLDRNAAERARQENAPTGYADWEMQQRLSQINERNQFFERAKQDSIVEDYGNNDPLSRMPEMRIDENGIPIRADLSMEAANLENPLQRNLFGDELPIRTGDNGIPLTQALDRMVPGPERDAAISKLRGDRGVLNMDIFKDGFKRIKELPDGIKLIFKGGGEPGVYAVQDDKIIGHAKFARDNVFVPKNEKQNLEATWIQVNPEHRSKGLPRQMYNFVNEIGNDIQASDIQTTYGKKMWENFEKNNLVRTEKTGIGNTRRLYQRGAIDPDLLTLGFTKLYHGGRKFKEWDPKTVGSGEGMGIMGPGLYAGDKPELAKQYLKYGGTNARLSDMAVDISRILETSKKFSPEMRVAYENATKALDDLGLRATQRGVKSALATAPKHLQQAAREAVIKAGIDGFKENLGAWGYEYSIFNPEVIKQISDAEGPVEKYVPRTQRGSIDVKEIAQETRKLAENISKIGKKAVNYLTPQEEAIPKVVRGDNYVPKGDLPEKIVNDALAEGKDGPSLNKWLQSGLQLAGEKAGSALQRGVARWLNWAEKMSNKQFRDYVQPLEQQFSGLSAKEKQTLQGILVEEMFNRKRFTADELTAAGANPKIIRAYENLRNTFEDALKRLNAGREKLGLKPLTGSDAYYSSMWNGNWHVPIYDKNGKLVWYVKTTSKAEANSAIAWMKENHGDTIDTSKLAPSYKPSEVSTRIPRDVTDVFSRVIELFGEDSPIGAEMARMMQEYQAEAGFNSRNFQTHFEQKANIRGFLGDRPWLSEKENAIQGLEAQIQYLKDAYRWAPMQEAIANVKEVLGNEQLMAQQPNNVAMSKAYLANAIGTSTNLFKNAENAVAKIIGQSPANLGQTVAGLKSLTYLQLLGLSTGYMLATPVQALILGPSRHMLLSQEGIKHNPVKTMISAISDGAKIVANHEVSNVRGKQTTIGLSPLGKEAMAYMEENGIATVNLFDEYSQLGQNPVMELGQKTLGYTISFPEKVARSFTFMSYVHHLNDGGFKGTKAEMFRLAEELTDDTLTKFSRTARPLAIDAMGQMGELAYTFKSPLFNYYNNLGLLANKAKATGNPLPLLMAAIVMPALLGGAMSVPGMQEADAAWNMYKEFIAKHYPEQYKKIKDFGIKRWMLENLPDIATYGAVSQVTGTQMASRFSTQIVDPNNPLADTAPVADTVGKVTSGLGVPIGIGSKEQWLYDNLPPAARGTLEVMNDEFKVRKNDDGTTTYYNPNKLSQREAYVNRTSGDEKARMLGLTSLPEARQRDVRYIGNQEGKRITAAREASMNKLFNAAVKNDSEGVKKYAEAYFVNEGSAEGFQRDLMKKINSGNFTPEQRQVLYANTMTEYMNLQRRKKMEQK